MLKPVLALHGAHRRRRWLYALAHVAAIGILLKAERALHQATHGRAGALAELVTMAITLEAVLAAHVTGGGLAVTLTDLAASLVAAETSLTTLHVAGER